MRTLVAAGAFLAVKKSVYREPPTAAGLEKIEKGTLDYLDKEVWSNLNTGVLEEYFEEKNRTESFSRSSVSPSP